MIGETRLGQTGQSAVSKVLRCYRFVIHNASFSTPDDISEAVTRPVAPGDDATGLFIVRH